MDFPEFNPVDTAQALEEFYSKHQLGQNGSPTTEWETENLTKIHLPYPLTLSFASGVEIERIRCHKKVAVSLLRVFGQILEHYGSVEAVKRARMHMFGGVFNFRMINDSDRLSVHAWGAAIDIDPERNPKGVAHDPAKGMIPLEVVAIFEKEGWRWDGRRQLSPNCSHFQATR